MKRIVNRFVRRGAVMVVMSLSLAAVAGGSYVVATRDDPPVTEIEESEPAPEDEAITEEEPAAEEEEKAEKAERFHGDAEHACEMPEGVKLEGNWNHGNYVSAWAKADDKEAKIAAAKSLCGKPQAAVDARLRKEAREVARVEVPKGHGKSDEHKKSDRGSGEGDDAPESETGD